ncbi:MULTISPECIES: FAD/NAD(P)-binding protein [Streptomyces]|uniref:FAD/NAD(P)-binding protein n=1 Tax=Streptomyces TaxID=1883 RepID=UPI0007C70D72|nr:MULTISPECIES: FAD/NAD(P)-binding protein [Streptomyces]
MNPADDPTSAVHRLALVGGGPRATYALERLSAQIARLGLDGRLDVRVFERSGEFGSGEAHSPSQPRTSYLNRISSQVSFAADESVKDAGPLRPAPLRPTLHEWCRRRFAETGHADLDLAPGDWPKRYVHGAALQDMFGTFVSELRARPGVEVRLHHTEVVDIAPHADGLVVHTADGEAFPVDQVLLVTGHTHHDPRRTERTRGPAEFADRTGCAYVPYAYPLDRALPPRITGPARVVGIAGLGLTAIDEILYLTEGRGGSFLPDADGGLRYRPSGAEPAKLLAFSETGVFTFARPDNRKEADPDRLEHRGVFLTDEAIDRLRTSVGTPRGEGGGSGQLDFERDVLPLVVLEMAWLHYATLFGRRAGDFLKDRAGAAYRAFLAGRSPHGDRPGDPTRLLGPLEAAVDEITAVLEAVLDGGDRQADAVARTPGWSAEEAMLRWIEVVFGAGPASRARTAWLRGPDALRRAVATWTSPWRLDERPAGNRFDWARTVGPLDAADLGTPGRYREALLDFMDRDQRWATQGNLDNPHKAAADGVWRDLRSVISRAVDDGGLTPASHRVFLSRYVRLHNRLANGAAPEVMERIRALVRHGLLDVGTGPGAELHLDEETGRFRVDGPATGASCRVDTLVDARVHAFDPLRDASPLFRNLLEHGTVRLWRNVSATGDAFEPGGLDLTDRHHPVRRDGTTEDRITVLGPPAEGRRSFLLSALRPDTDHYVMRDTVTWLDGFWQLLERSRAARR